jgi:hypothetical protein
MGPKSQLAERDSSDANALETRIQPHRKSGPGRLRTSILGIFCFPEGSASLILGLNGFKKLALSN